MMALPPVAPVTGLRRSQVLPRDYYVRVDGNDYSVHPAAIGHRIEVVVDLHRVRAFQGGRIVADHQRIWARHQTVSDPAHVAAADVLRRERVRVVRPPVAQTVEVRALSEYDRVLGLVEQADAGTVA
jgi:hypothetical protein